jgi:hypothetical protein
MLAQHGLVHRFAAVDGLDCEALFDEVALEQLAQAQIVVDDENPVFAVCHGDECYSDRGAGGARGNKALQTGARRGHKMPAMNARRWKLLSVLVVALAAVPALAQPGQGQGARREAMRAERGVKPSQFAEQMRRGYGDETSRVAPMSAEERRQLRRDIHEAGRELYRRHPHRGPSRAREATPPG